jgi:WD40 repeat protein
MSPTRSLGLSLLAVLVAAPVFGQTDLFGDPLPAGAVSRIGTLRYRVRGWHQQVFFSADGKTVVAKGENGMIHFFEAETGKPLGTLKDAGLSQWHADQSPDGKFLALVGLDWTDEPRSAPTVRLYDLTTRKLAWTSRLAEAESPSQMKVRFAPDGKHLVTAGPDVRVWDAKTGKEVARQKIASGYGGMDISPDGKTVAVAHAGLTVWDWTAGGAPRKLDPGPRIGGDSVRFAPDGKTLYVTGIGSPTIGAVDVATGKPAGRLEGISHTGRVTFSPDGTRYAAETYNRSDGKTWTAVRDVATGAELARLDSGADAASGGSWSPDGTRYAAVNSYRVWVWDAKTGKAFGPDTPAHGAGITEMAFNPDGRLFTASDDHTVRAWDAATGKQLMVLPMAYWVRGLAVSADGSLVTGNALRNDFRVWDAKTGKEVFKLHGHGSMGGLRRVRFSADDQRLVSFGDDHYLRTWDTRTGKLTGEYRFRPPGRPGVDPDDDIHADTFGYRVVDLGPDGRTLALGYGKDVRVIDTETGKQRYQVEADPGGREHDRPVPGREVDGDGRPGSGPAAAEGRATVGTPEGFGGDRVGRGRGEAGHELPRPRVDVLRGVRVQSRWPADRDRGPGRDPGRVGRGDRGGRRDDRVTGPAGARRVRRGRQAGGGRVLGLDRPGVRPGRGTEAGREREITTEDTENRTCTVSP